MSIFPHQGPVDRNPRLGPQRWRIGLVVQRYGIEINGGAELHARQVAERLAQRHAVTILSSCALDYTTWAMHYPPGLHTVNGLRVLRFPHPLRNDLGPARVPRRHKWRFRLRSLLDALGIRRVLEATGDAADDGLDFLRRQGPHCPDLFQHLSDHAPDYDVVIFFTALYEPTALGLPAWGRRSLLVPTLHDEKAMYLPCFHRVFASAGVTLYNTASERRLASALYGRPPDEGEVVGLGIEVERPDPTVLAEVQQRFSLPERYIVYVGRIDPAKGCDVLLAAFGRLASTKPSMALVLVGQRFMPLPAHPQIYSTGFVTEADRNAIVAGALALVVPSRYESLSMVLLEAMKLQVPVVANAQCEVLAEHIEASGAGWVYRTQRQLTRLLRHIANSEPSDCRSLGLLGEAYVTREYGWPRVMSRYEAALSTAAGTRGDTTP
jgi:glycosyltransferase involved in cell wall biosynthesis